MYTEKTPLLSKLTALSVADYINQKPIIEYNYGDVEYIVKQYFEACANTGLDPVMVIAQMLHETGNLTSFWSQRPRRNPAGLGVTGQKSQTDLGENWAYDPKDKIWRYGLSFDDWSDSVAAHIGRLLAYGLTDRQANMAQLRYINYALDLRELPRNYRGAITTWEGLNGKWAVPGTSYAQTIAALANRIKTFTES